MEDVKTNVVATAPDVRSVAPPPSEGAGFTYQRSDGTVEHAATAVEAVAQCPYLGRLAVEAPDQLNTILKFAAMGTATESQTHDEEKSEQPQPATTHQTIEPTSGTKKTSAKVTTSDRDKAEDSMAEPDRLRVANTLAVDEMQARAARQHIYETDFSDEPEGKKLEPSSNDELSAVPGNNQAGVEVVAATQSAVPKRREIEGLTQSMMAAREITAIDRDDSERIRQESLDTSNRIAFEVSSHRLSDAETSPVPHPAEILQTANQAATIEQSIVRRITGIDDSKMSNPDTHDSDVPMQAEPSVSFVGQIVPPPTDEFFHTVIQQADDLEIDADLPDQHKAEALLSDAKFPEDPPGIQSLAAEIDAIYAEAFPDGVEFDGDEADVAADMPMIGQEARSANVLDGAHTEVGVDNHDETVIADTESTEEPHEIQSLAAAIDSIFEEVFPEDMDLAAGRGDMVADEPIISTQSRFDVDAVRPDAGTFSMRRSETVPEAEVQETFLRLKLLAELSELRNASDSPEPETNRIVPSAETELPDTNKMKDIDETYIAPVSSVFVKSVEAAEPVALDVIKRHAQKDRPLNEVLVELAAFVEASAEAAGVEVKADTADVKEIVELLQTLDDSVRTGYSLELPKSVAAKARITPELTEKLLQLLKHLGYQDPQNTLIDFVALHDLDYLSSAVEYLCELSDKANRKEFLPSVTLFPSQGEDPSWIRLGKMLLGLATKAALEPVA